MSPVSVSIDPTTSWALICDYQSGHCFHLSVVSQHVRRQSLERPEARFTLCFKTAPPLRHPFLGKLPGVALHFLKAQRWNVHRQRLEMQNRNIHGDEVCCQFAIQNRLSHHCPNPTSYGSRSRKSAIHRAAQGLASGVLSPSNPSVGLLRRQPSNQRRNQLHKMRKILHQRLRPLGSSHSRRKAPVSTNARPPCSS